ncbi:hypothetical protein KEM52_006190, partial [Ascosphaera acerosa]
LFGFDPFYGQHVPADFAHNFYHAVTLEDTESLSRPRLTKEQVDTLEAQFQAHPKPNSSVKRQLAMQTNLTLPRVANWFQNRRAKAKQQKRQAEYEKKLAEEKAEKEGKAAGAGTAGTATSEEPQQSTALAASGQDAAAASRATPVSDGKPSMDKEEVKTIHESDTQAHTHTQQQAHARTPDLAESRIDISPQMLHSATQAEHPKRHEATVAAACHWVCPCRATYRVFGEKQWAEVQGRLMVWRQGLENVLHVIRSEKERYVELVQQDMQAQLAGKAQARR